MYTLFTFSFTFLSYLQLLILDSAIKDCHLKTCRHSNLFHAVFAGFTFILLTECSTIRLDTKLSLSGLEEKLYLTSVRIKLKLCIARHFLLITRNRADPLELIIRCYISNVRIVRNPFVIFRFTSELILKRNLISVSIATNGLHIRVTCRNTSELIPKRNRTSVSIARNVFLRGVILMIMSKLTLKRNLISVSIVISVLPTELLIKIT